VAARYVVGTEGLGIGKIGEPDGVTGAILRLAFYSAEIATGSSFPEDGGWVAR
jgi:hypothetical protein